MKHIITFMVVFTLNLTAISISAADQHTITLPTTSGKLTITPLNDNSVRVRYMEGNPYQVEELLYTQQVAAPKPKLSQSGNITRVKLKNMTVEYDRTTQSLRFYDRKGKIVLAEQPGGRSVSTSSTTMPDGQTLLDVQQSFISPADEYLYGT